MNPLRKIQYTDLAETGNQDLADKVNELVKYINMKTSKNNWHKSDTVITDFIEWLEEENRQDWEIERAVEDLLDEQKEEILEHQYDMMMKCLPSDAENLSTLTPDQAFRLMRCFIKSNPWN
jgi:hypothetical protein